MHLSETTHYLYATVAEWSYGGSPQRLTLSGATREFADVPAPPPLNLGLSCVNDHSESEAPLAPWQSPPNQLNLTSAWEWDGHKFPESLEAWLPIPEMQFHDLKECLFLMAQSPDCSVRLSLSIREKLEVPPVDRPQRFFAIVDFSYTLHYQRSNG